ncbi:PREDICTED: neuronal acetylcholine receptor subunit alpha-4-like isoform X2 [Branchiostoma belcheri]|uniref:Neuronal acetylcholine receptor subunit alpha-4-like isoform X2 n=1 Tax=Branchiostoma belcheri TaxID=7741 RepID=A0A6P4ZES2_BRABE|nr:PREDICTED: neuronal acetylcholine receptor subunit alpha-4-like isoform X2 [Branchiostoma belcheri]
MLLYVLLVIGLFVSGALGLEAREQLYRDLFLKYNKVPRPVKNVTDKVTIKFGIAISQLIDVDEKNQVLTTSVWLRQEWFDYKLNWNPEDYGNLTYIRVPSTEIWVPDVVLYNNADGSFDVAAKTRAQVFHDGRVRWIPPALYKSYCYIDVRFFPFDQQNCSMKFGTWTYDFTLVDMTLWENAMDRANFRESGEWIVIDAPVYRHVEDYACCPPYVDVTGYLVIQRLPLFFTVNLIVPCVLFSFISLFVFYLPSNCGEKITLSISVLLSLSVFLLVIFNTIPSTSLAVPLIGKYLLFTVTMVATSITATVFVSNIYHRSGSTHDMSEWVRVVFLRWLPGILCMRRPGDEASIEKDLHMSLPDLEETKLATALQYVKMRRMRARRQTGEDREEYQKCPVRTIEAPEEARPALEGLEYVTSFLKRQDKCDALEEDWNYIAMIIDRIFLWVFSIVCLLGTGCIFLEPFVTENKATPA